MFALTLNFVGRDISQGKTANLLEMTEKEKGFAEAYFLWNGLVENNLTPQPQPEQTLAFGAQAPISEIQAPSNGGSLLVTTENTEGGLTDTQSRLNDWAKYNPTSKPPPNAEEPPEIRFGQIEDGGAEGQVKSYHKNQDPTEQTRKVSEQAPSTGKRPLGRAENGAGTEPNSEPEIIHIVEQGYMDDDNDNVVHNQKIFSSQGVFERYITSLKAANAYARKTGIRVKVHIACPCAEGFPDGKGWDPKRPEFNPYPMDFYKLFVREAITFARSDLDCILEEDIEIGPKSMKGDIRKGSEIHQTFLDEFINAEGGKFRGSYGFHLHGEQPSEDAFIEAVETAKKHSIPMSGDIGAGKGTGFLDAATTCRKLRDKGLITISDAQINVLEQMAKHVEHALDENNVLISEGGLTLEEKCAYDIPSGGEETYYTSVRNYTLKYGTTESGDVVTQATRQTIASKLKLSDQEAYHVGGHALIAVTRLLGYAFPVTPGFLRKQQAAIHLIDRMIAHGYIHHEMSLEDINNAIIEELSDQQVNDFFIANLPAPVADFIKNNRMPTEHPELNIDLKYQVRPLVRQYFPLNPVLEAPDETRYLRHQDHVSHLQRIGLVRPTHTMTRKILRSMAKNGQVQEENIESIISRLDERGIIYTESNGQECAWFEEADREFNALREEGLIRNSATESSEADSSQDVAHFLMEELRAYAHHSAVYRQIILRDEPLEYYLRRPWLSRPNAPLHKGNVPEYERTLRQNFNKLSARLDRDSAEILRQHLLAGNVKINEATEITDKLYQQEWLGIRASVIEYLRANPNQLFAALETSYNNTLLEGNTPMTGAIDNLREAVIELQQTIINEERTKNGREFYYPQAERVAIATGFLMAEIREMTEALDATSLEQLRQSVNIDKTPYEIHSPMTGGVLSILVKPGNNIKTGDAVAVIEAMKMEHTICAAKGGTVRTVPFSIGDQVKEGESLVFCKAEQFDPNFMELHLEKLTEENLLEQDKINSYLSEHAPKDVIGYRAEETAHQIQDPKIDTDSEYVDLVINRAGCAAKLSGDLIEAGNEVYVVYERADKHTPVIQNFDPDKTIQIRNYQDYDVIIKATRDIHEKTGKKVRVHPGWGFLSEDPEFVATFEKAFADNREAIFIGPSAEAIEIIGGKLSLRELIDEIDPEFNPRFFASGDCIEPIEALLEKDLDRETDTTLYDSLRADFKNIIKMGGAVAIKSIDGGGGKGQGTFHYNADENKDINFKRYVEKLVEVRSYARTHYRSDVAVVEQFVDGNTHHIEAQLAATNGEVAILGYRDCTLQQDNQKLVEMNLINGDYSPELIAKIQNASKEIGKRIAERGYTGVGTLEMLVVPETNEVKILEVNTRIQVEHGVTEGDIKAKTGQDLRIVNLNNDLITNELLPPEIRLSPQDILEQKHGLNAEDQENIQNPGNERYLEFRINTKSIDLIQGSEAKPTQFADTMMSSHLKTEIKEDTPDVVVIEGGKGTGSYDSQIGALLGKYKDVTRAVSKAIKFYSLSEMFDRAASPVTSLNTVAYLLDNVFLLPNGKINPKSSVGLVGKIQKEIREGGDLHRFVRPNYSRQHHRPTAYVPVAEAA